MNEASSPAQPAAALGRIPSARAAPAAFSEPIDPVTISCGQARPRARRTQVECGDLPFLIRRDGSWLYRGSPIGRKELVCLFASVLRREADGSYYLETPAERGRIEVEDVPFVAVELDIRGDGRGQELVFRTNLDEIVIADRAHPLRVEARIDGGPCPYIHVRNGLEARLARPVFYCLVEAGCERRIGRVPVFGVWSKAVFFPLGTLSA